MLEVERVRSKRANRFMTTEEARILWQYAQRWSTKFQVMLGFALFRGMRISEICAINLYDFKDDNFGKLDVILSKSHIRDEFPIIGHFAGMVRKYIRENIHTFKDGYIFPYYSSRKHAKHISVKTAEALFAKLRKIIGRDHPQFLDKSVFSGRRVYYRIGWHSCRRWFETQLWEEFRDKMLIRDVMRYRESRTVDVYINPYEVWKKEREILQKTFSSVVQDFALIQEGQKKLSSFF